MSKVTTRGKWLFEVKEVRAIRAEEYGKPYDAQLTIKIVNGEVHVENLMIKDEKSIKLTDWKAVDEEVLSHGHREYSFDRYDCNGNKRKVKRVIKVND